MERCSCISPRTGHTPLFPPDALIYHTKDTYDVVYKKVSSLAIVWKKSPRTAPHPAPSETRIYYSAPSGIIPSGLLNQKPWPVSRRCSQSSTRSLPRPDIQSDLLTTFRRQARMQYSLIADALIVQISPKYSTALQSTEYCAVLR